MRLNGDVERLNDAPVSASNAEGLECRTKNWYFVSNPSVKIQVSKGGSMTRKL